MIKYLTGLLLVLALLYGCASATAPNTNAIQQGPSGAHYFVESDKVVYQENGEKATSFDKVTALELSTLLTRITASGSNVPDLYITDIEVKASKKDPADWIELSTGVVSIVPFFIGVPCSIYYTTGATYNVRRQDDSLVYAGATRKDNALAIYRGWFILRYFSKDRALGLGPYAAERLAGRLIYEDILKNITTIETRAADLAANIAGQ